MRIKVLAAACAAFVLAGCETAYQNNPSPWTGREQQLRTHSAVGAARMLVRELKLPRDATVYVVPPLFDLGPGAPELLQAVRLRFKGDDYVVVDDVAHASAVVEIMVLAHGFNHVDRVLGLPATSIPSVQPGVPPFSIPELSLWSEHRSVGVTELQAVATNAAGHRISAAGPVLAETQIIDRRLFTAFVSGDELDPPEIRTRANP